MLYTLALMGSLTSAYAQNGNQAVEIPLTVGYFDPTIGVTPGHPKGPVQVPYVILDDHTLYICSQHSGFTLTLLDDSDTVVYQTYLPAGVQFCALPPTLSGSYTLQLSNDTYLFTGMIDLE